MVSLKENLNGFVQTNPTNVKRSGESYAQTHAFMSRVLRISVTVYRKLVRHDMTARLLRDVMDWALRRYHGYCIEENFGAHYREVGIKKKRGNIFEHAFPARLARDLMIHDKITIEQAMNIPTCLLSKKHDVILNKKFSKTTPDLYFFFKRYAEAIPDVKIETHRGDPINLETWSLQDHYNYFNIQG
jgi:hypothetical protein